MTIDPDAFGRLGAAARELYAASHDAAAWPGMLRAIAHVFDAEVAFVRLATGDSPEDQFLAACGYSQSDLEEYARDYAHEDYWSIEGPAKARPHTPMTGDQLASREKMERTAALHHFAGRFGVTDCLAMPLARRDGVVSCLSVNGRGDGGRFRASHLELARLLQPHLEQAILARRRLGGPDDALVGARLEALGIGMALFTRDGRLAYETPAFSRLAAAASVFRGPARAPFQEETPSLGALIAGTLASGAGGSLAVSAGGLGPLLVRCAPKPVHPWVASLVEPPGVMITLELLEPARTGSIDVAAEIWALSGREREVLHVLAEERSLVRAAGRLGITHETARTHAKRIYQKAGVHSLQELLTAAAAARITRR